MNTAKRNQGFSLIELMVVVVIAALLMALGVTWALPVLQQNKVVRELVTLKGSFQQARARAIERNAPVQFTFTGNVLHVLADYDRDGSFGDTTAELVIGESLTQGVEMGDSKVHQTDSSIGPLNHWSGLAEVQAIPDFPNDQFIITPTGLIVDSVGQPLRGAFFLVNDDGFRGALYVSMLGDVKTALKQNAETATPWVWND